MGVVALMTALALAGTGCVHSQRPEPRVYVIAEDTRGAGTSLGIGGAGDRDCQAEHEECFRRCWGTTPPYPHRKGDGWHYEYCTTKCRKEYNDCVDEQEEREKERERERLRFSSVDQAVDWIRDHKAEVAIGTVIIIAGVAFVITTGGSGALILAPLAL